MQLRGLRRGFVVVALAGSLSPAGCNALGLGSPTSGGTLASAAAPEAPGDSWTVLEEGTPTISPTAAGGVPQPTESAPFLTGSPHTGCPGDWSADAVLIPLTVTTGPGSVTVTWAPNGSSAYRITAVLQDIVVGSQLEPVWKPVVAGTGCSVSGTITGLDPGKPYVVWLDAPTGDQRDGTPNPNHGRSGIVRPG